MTNAYGMTPESYRSYNFLHALLGLVLAALLFVLPWLTGGRIGPRSWQSCSAAPSALAAAAVSPPRPVAAAPVPPPPVAAVPIPAPPPPVVVATAPPVPAPAAPIPAARVYFALDRFNLPQDVDKTLADVIGFLKSHPTAKASLSGFHDPQGQGEAAKQHNEMLAKNRAGAVRDALQQAGIAQERISMQKPAETTGGGSHEEARRVEVSIQP